MHVRSLPFAATFVVLAGLSGCRNIEPAPPPDAPRIESFTASKSRVSPGEPVTLTFTTVNATKVEILDDAGNELALSGEVSSGTATVSPTASSFYVLRATGTGGRDTAFVQVAVNEALKEVFLLAVPASIAAGQQAQLLWSAPGATSVTLTTGSGAPAPLVGSTGSVTVTPTASERYTLTANGAPGTPPLTALADVQVGPVMTDASLTALDGFVATKTVTVKWRTAGASRIVVSEQTFGQLSDITDPSDVVMGAFNYALPSTLPNGIAVSDGLPLRFSVTAFGGGLSVSRTLTAVVGDAPAIALLETPAAATTGRTFTTRWRTANATSVEVQVAGQPVWRSLPNELARVAEGTVDLPTPNAMTEYTFVATNHRGARAERTFTLRPVAVPQINTFTLTPTVNAFGDSASAQWTTTAATVLQLRLENGPTLVNVTAPSTVASGNRGLVLATSARVELVAFNAAGDSVTATRTFTFAGPVNVTPRPALRGTPVVVDWALASGGAIEVVGLPTPAPAPVASSVAFVDLTTRTTAAPLAFADPIDGSERVTLPAGFRFPLLGRFQQELWVSVNGFVSPTQLGAQSSNLDLAPTLADGGVGSTTAPTILAPFWDDLVLGMNSRVLVDTVTTTNGERFLVVQWDDVQVAGDASSSLTFQAHLYETGQVAFVYETMTGALNSATIGVRDATWPLSQQYSFNSMTTLASPGLELNYFTGGPADGTLTFTSAKTTALSFVGRTTTGALGVSAQILAFGVGDVVVSEAMPAPQSASLSFGQWVEFRNNQPSTVDFGGLVVRSPGSDGGYVFPAGTTVDAGGFLVVGQSLDAQLNGGATVHFETDNVPLTVPGSVNIALRSPLSDGGALLTALGALSWVDAGVTPAASVFNTNEVMVASGGTFACSRMSSFGTAGALGTPGRPNDPCSPYAVTSIPGNFLAAPASARFVIPGTSTNDNYTTRSLPRPFTYFGTSMSSYGISNNGFITLSTTPLTSSSFSNPTTPSTSQPNGVLALFWDDLSPANGGINAEWRLSDRTIISFENYGLWDDPTATTLNFQVHLLDSGVIEFHYGTLSTTLQSYADQVTGSSATVWLERQDGAIAVAWSVNRAQSLQPHSGIRFTPVP